MTVGWIEVSGLVMGGMLLGILLDEQVTRWLWPERDREV